MIAWLLLLIPLTLLIRWSALHRADEVRARIVEVLAAATRRGLPLELAPLRMGAELPRAARGRVVKLERRLSDGEPILAALGASFPRLFRAPAAHEVPAHELDVAAQLAAMAAGARTRGARRERVITALLYPTLLLAGGIALQGRLESLGRVPGAPDSHAFTWLPDAATLGLWLGIGVAASVVVAVLTNSLAARVPAVRVCVDQFRCGLPVTGRCRRLRQTAKLLRGLAAGCAAAVPLDRSVAHAATTLEGTRLGREWRGAAHLLSGGEALTDVLGQLPLPDCVRHRLAPALRRSDQVAARGLTELATECESRATTAEARAIRWIRPGGLLLAAAYLFVSAHYLSVTLDGARAEAMPW